MHWARIKENKGEIKVKENKCESSTYSNVWNLIEVKHVE